jgi:translation initiation factor 5A
VGVPIVTRNVLMLLDIDHDDGFLSLFVKETGETRDDLKLPKGDVGEKLLGGLGKKGQDVVVVVLASMGQEIVVDVREEDKE